MISFSHLWTLQIFPICFKLPEGAHASAYLVKNVSTPPLLAQVSGIFWKWQLKMFEGSCVEGVPVCGKQKFLYLPPGIYTRFYLIHLMYCQNPKISDSAYKNDMLLFLNLKFASHNSFSNGMLKYTIGKIKFSIFTRNSDCLIFFQQETFNLLDELKMLQHAVPEREIENLSNKFRTLNSWITLPFKTFSH